MSGLTLADCGLIVLGAALVLALPFPDAWGDPGSQDAVLRWHARLGIAWNGIGRAGLALLCVAVFRAARAGRPIRPAELLLAIVAGPVLAQAVDASAWVSGSTYRVPIGSQPNSYLHVPGGPFWWTHAAAVAVGVGAAIVLWFARRRLPALAASLLLVVIALSAAWIRAPSAHAMYAWSALHHPVSLAAYRSISVIQQAISDLIPAMVAVLAIRELFHRRRSFGTLEWIGLTLFSASFLISVASPLIYLIRIGAPMTMLLTHAIVAVVGPLVALVVGVSLVVALRRVFSRPARLTPPPSTGRVAVSSHRSSPPTGS